jgi:hypothetical protein
MDTSRRGVIGDKPSFVIAIAAFNRSHFFPVHHLQRILSRSIKLTRPYHVGCKAPATPCAMANLHSSSLEHSRARRTARSSQQHHPPRTHSTISKRSRDTVAVRICKSPTAGCPKSSLRCLAKHTPLTCASTRRPQRRAQVSPPGHEYPGELWACHPATAGDDECYDVSARAVGGFSVD